MNKHLFPTACALLSATLPVAAFAEFTKGGAAYTNRVETPLLAEPSALSATVAKVGYAKALKVDDLKGPWLKVTEGTHTGWVFAGNVAEEKPEENKGTDGLPVAAAATTATAAARPLTPAATEYAQRQGINSAGEDIKWMVSKADAITPEQVQAFLKEKKKGEFQ